MTLTDKKFNDIDDLTHNMAIIMTAFALFVSDFMAPVVGNADKSLPTDCREKSMVSFEVENVDETYRTFSAKGVSFINQPTDMPDWGMRVVHLRDPEENLIEFFTPLVKT